MARRAVPAEFGHRLMARNVHRQFTGLLEAMHAPPVFPRSMSVSMLLAHLGTAQTLDYFTNCQSVALQGADQAAFTQSE